MTAYIGTSGWSYKDWGKRFYPEGLPAREQLSFLAKTFNTVELNASFYRLPGAKTFASWRHVTPDSFRFAVKASRHITHIKRLDDVKESWDLLLERSQPMGDKLSVFLLQFPPSWSAGEENLSRLDKFLTYAVKAKMRLAFEFRHKSCFESPVLDVLREYKACLVFADSSRFPHSPLDFAPADFVYYRFHGPKKLYSSQYGREGLKNYADSMNNYLVHNKDVYAYFDNDVQGYALGDAKMLQVMLNS